MIIKNTDLIKKKKNKKNNKKNKENPEIRKKQFL